MATPVVLVHGGGLDRRCWDLLVPHLDAPSLAVDLPGRGSHPMPLGEVDFAACAATVVADIDAAGFDEVVLAGHSLAGCSMPAIAAALGDRLRHAVFIACTVPEDGRSSYDTLDPEIQELIEANPDAASGLGVMDADLARIVLGADLTEEQLRWCTDRLVPEAPRLNLDAVDLEPLRRVPATWVRTVHDVIVPADKQLRFAGNVGGHCRVVDIDAGHMCMVSRPAATARILDEAAGSTPK